ncbi:MAG: recombinase RecT [Oligoflexia bacterium]|nr:recombinase RecT [Oligoflexia bacterium]
MNNTNVPVISLSDSQIQLIKTQIMPLDSTNDELKLFCMRAERAQLDPFARQIYAIRRNGKMSYEVSIDGARLVAERTGRYKGQQGPWWCDSDGVWVSMPGLKTNLLWPLKSALFGMDL